MICGQKFDRYRVRSYHSLQSGMEDFDRFRDRRIIERARQGIARSRDLLNKLVPKIVTQSDRAKPKSCDQVSNQNTTTTKAVPLILLIGTFRVWLAINLCAAIMTALRVSLSVGRYGRRSSRPP
jgi:hypothetical protein